LILRCRAVTPPEEIALVRERIFQDDEERAVERSAMDDSSYHGSSSQAESNKNIIILV
jgi:hypothetical protein